MYLVVVDTRECRTVSISVLLLIVSSTTQHGCQGHVVSFYLPIGAWVVCRGEKIRDLENPIYTLKEIKCKLFSVV